MPRFREIFVYKIDQGCPSTLIQNTISDFQIQKNFLFGAGTEGQIENTECLKMSAPKNDPFGKGDPK